MTHESADKNVVKMMGHRICIIGIVLAALESYIDAVLGALQRKHNYY